MMTLVKKVSSYVSIYKANNEYIVKVLSRGNFQLKVKDWDDAEYHAETIDHEIQHSLKHSKETHL